MLIKILCNINKYEKIWIGGENNLKLVFSTNGKKLSQTFDKERVDQQRKCRRNTSDCIHAWWLPLKFLWAVEEEHNIKVFIEKTQTFFSVRRFFCIDYWAEGNKIHAWRIIILLAYGSVRIILYTSLENRKCILKNVNCWWVCNICRILKLI